MRERVDALADRFAGMPPGFRLRQQGLDISLRELLLLAETLADPGLRELHWQVALRPELERFLAREDPAAPFVLADCELCLTQAFVEHLGRGFAFRFAERYREACRQRQMDQLEAMSRLVERYEPHFQYQCLATSFLLLDQRIAGLKSLALPPRGGQPDRDQLDQLWQAADPRFWNLLPDFFQPLRDKLGLGIGQLASHLQKLAPASLLSLRLLESAARLKLSEAARAKAREGSEPLRQAFTCWFCQRNHARLEYHVHLVHPGLNELLWDDMVAPRLVIPCVVCDRCVARHHAQKRQGRRNWLLLPALGALLGLLLGQGLGLPLALAVLGAALGAALAWRGGQAQEHPSPTRLLNRRQLRLHPDIARLDKQGWTIDSLSQALPTQKLRIC